MNVIDKLAWIEIQNKQILSTKSFGKDKYYIPGGKREAGESDKEALVREIKEELSVDLIDESIQYVGTFEAQAHGKPEGINVKMTCYTASYTGQIKNAAEIEEVIWLNYADKDKTSGVDIIIFDFLKERGELA
jgi:8-oxo-dGTP diphosphatase